MGYIGFNIPISQRQLTAKLKQVIDFILNETNQIDFPIEYAKNCAKLALLLVKYRAIIFDENAKYLQKNLGEFRKRWLKANWEKFV